MPIQFSTTGYKHNSPDVNNDYNLIKLEKGSTITMDGVLKKLLLVPIGHDGKPCNDCARVASPGDKDYVFDTDKFSAVLETPFNDEKHGRFFNSEGQPKMELGNIPGLFNIDWEDVVNTFSQKRTNLNTNVADPFANLYGKTVGFPQQSGEDVFGNIFKNNTKEEDEEDLPSSLYNLFSNMGRGWNTESSLVNLGEMIGIDRMRPGDEGYTEETAKQRNTGKTLGLIGSIGNSTLNVFKNILTGYGAQNRLNEARKDVAENLRKARDKKNQIIVKNGGVMPSFQTGGQSRDNRVLTGAVTTGLPKNSVVVPNAEVEDGEYLREPGKPTAKVEGEKHTTGGEPMDLEQGTQVLTDFLTIGKEFSKIINNEYNIKTKPKDTFATVMDKYKRSIGYDKLIKDYEDVIGKVKDQEKVKNEATRELNLAFLSGKVAEFEDKKKELDQMIEPMMSLLFDEQEFQKESGIATDKKGKKFQEGGEMSGDNSANIIQAFSEVSGTSVEELQDALQQLSPEEQTAAINQMEQQLQQGSSNEGDESDTNPEQIVQAFAQATNQDPQDVAQKLSELSPEEQQQALQEMVQYLQQGQGEEGQSVDLSQLSEEDIKQIISAFAEMNGQDPQEVMNAFSELSPEEQQQALQEMIGVLQQAMSQSEQQQPEPTGTDVDSFSFGGWRLPKYQEGATTFDFRDVSRRLRVVLEKTSKRRISKVEREKLISDAVRTDKTQSVKVSSYPVDEYINIHPDGKITSNNRPYESYTPQAQAPRRYTWADVPDWPQRQSTNSTTPRTTTTNTPQQRQAPTTSTTDLVKSATTINPNLTPDEVLELLGEAKNSGDNQLVASTNGGNYYITPDGGFTFQADRQTTNTPQQRQSTNSTTPQTTTTNQRVTIKFPFDKYKTDSGWFAGMNQDAVADNELQHDDGSGRFSLDEDTFNTRLNRLRQNIPTVFNSVEPGNTRNVMQAQGFYNNYLNSSRDLFVNEFSADKDTVDSFVDDSKFVYNSNNTARGIDGKVGNYTTTRNWFQRALLTEEQEKALHDLGIYTATQAMDREDEVIPILGKEKMDEIRFDRNKYSDADYVLARISSQTPADNSVQPDGDTSSDENTNECTGGRIKDENGNCNCPENTTWDEEQQKCITPATKGQKKASNVSFQQQSSDLPPYPYISGMSSMQSVRPQFADAFNQSKEELWKEVSRNTGLATNTFQQAPNLLSVAAIANTMGLSMDQARNAMAQIDQQNAQTNMQKNQFNAGQVGAADKMNTELAVNYENMWLRTLANLESQKLGYWNYGQKAKALQQANIMNRNMLQSMHPDTVMDSQGNVYNISSFLRNPSPATDGIGFEEEKKKKKPAQSKTDGRIKSTLLEIMLKSRN